MPNITVPNITVIGTTESADWHELSKSAWEILQSAELIFAAERHLQKLGALCNTGGDTGIKGALRHWSAPLSDSLEEIDKARKAGHKIAVLATGDPMFFGIGATLARHFGAENISVLPSVGAFAIATAKLGWASDSCDFTTLHGRSLKSLRRYLKPHGKILALSRDKDTPAAVAELLKAENYHDATLHVLCDLGSPSEKIHYFADLDKVRGAFSDLNTVAISLGAGRDSALLPPYMLLRDDDFRHDGQITKEEVRAVTLLRLRPFKRAHLWDLGAGCGSISLSWMLAGGTATAIERHPNRCQFIKDNAEDWGLESAIEIRQSDIGALDFAELPLPDAIFCGGGMDSLDLLEKAYKLLKNNGIFVINAVTLEASESLHGFHKKHGGDLARLQIERPDKLGERHGFKPHRTVLQFWRTKP